MVLAIDIGNTNIVVGCFDEENILFVERVSTNHTATDLEYASTIRMALHIHGYESSMLTGAIISSVVPGVTGTVKRAIEKYAGVKVMVVSPGIKTGIKLLVDNPAQLGSDLVVDAVAGINHYSVPLIIIDMGTATTLSVIDKNKNYIGGMIMTGVAISADALTSRTAQLPRIAFDAPNKLIGKNTVDCMKNGIMYSNACALDGLIERVEEELGEPCTVVATGGIANVITPLCKKKIIMDDALLLKGLMIIYQKNL
ncbi:MAG: type III pantothenate kinase [Clostridia bacterium]|nr:type III pantothenate kinase [Clostridia bacterium]